MLNLNLFEKIVDNAFEGTVYKVKVDDLDKIFLNNLNNFTDSGIVSFFRSCKIPSPKFFLEKPKDYIQETFLNQKAVIKEKGDILLLIRDDKIVYATTENKIIQEDPTIKFDLTDWKFNGEDIMKGIRRYVYAPDNLVLGKEDKFITTVYMTIPILYSKDIILETGLFRFICENGLLTKVEESNQVKIPKETYSNHLLFEPLLSGVISGIISTQNSNKEFIEFLENKIMPEHDQIKDKLQVLTEDKVISKKVSLYSSRHLDILEKKEVISDITFPDTVSTLMDFVNLLTRFAQESNTLTQQVKMEKSIFDFVYQQFHDECKKDLRPLNLEELLENLNTRSSEFLQGASV